MRIIASRYAEIANTRRVGGQGEVFQASDLHQGGRMVAVKLLPATADDIYRIYFERSTAANRKLNHPNIAALLDSGIDDALGAYYLVMDWVPETLSTWLAGLEGPPGWDDLAESVALPLASALAHSHSLAVLHRDVKPTNVLWNGTGPILTDFALSKIKDHVAAPQDATVVGSTNAPWAPPDQASRGSARFDVYGLAATLLQCVTAWPIQDFPDIAKALDGADVPPQVLDVLARALAPDPQARHADGQVLLVELQAIQDVRNSRWRKQKVVAFELSQTARRALDEVSGQRPEVAVSGLLGESTVALPRLESGPDGRNHYNANEFRLIGDQLELGMVFTDQYRLLAKWAKVTDFEELERFRANEDAVPIDGRDFVWSAERPANPKQAAMAALEIRTMLNKAVQDFGDRFSERFKQARLNNWSQLIDAKEQLERRLEEPISYEVVGRSGVEFALESPVAVPAAVLDQERVARPADDPSARGVPVSVVDVDGTDLVVRMFQSGRDLPHNGVLVRDRRASQAAIKRQKTALAALREGSSARPHLRELVLDPEVAMPPVPVAFQPVTPGLDQDKVVAVASALGSEDLYLVEGPPGTGKTSFICELVNQYLAARPGDKILLVSQMHVAIDNAVTRLYDSGVTDVVRLSSRDDKVDPDAAHLLLSNKLVAWTTEIANRAQRGIATLADRQGIKVEYIALALTAEEARAALRDLAERREALGVLEPSDRLDNEDLPDERATLLADYYRASERAQDAIARARQTAQALGEGLADDNVGDTELEALIRRLVGDRPGHQRLRELLQLQGDWLNSLGDPQASEPLFLPTQSVVAGTCMGFLSNAKVQEMQFDLCIIDEASRATASELLVPMTRSKRWVMVGDPKQLPPMAEDVFEHKDLVDEFELDKLFHSSSLFDILLAEAPNDCRTRLTTQHRMAVPIGTLISETFYNGELIHDPFPVLSPQAVNDSDRLVWYSTSRRSDRAEEPKHTRGESSSNKLEALEISKLVARLEAEARNGRLRRLRGGPVTVLILTGYRAQCVEIDRAIRRLRLSGVTVTVNTVDAVQGREADVVIFSVTRSNLTGTMGFLDERYSGRINVALSRAREILWIVGDSEFAASKDGPLKRALTHFSRSGIGRIEYL